MHASIALGITAASATDTGSLISVLGGLVALIITIAGGVGTWAALRVGRNSQVISNYKATAESWENRATALKAENEGLTDELTDARQEISDLHTKVGTLQDLATGQPAVQQISTEMKEGFKKVAEQLDSFGGRLDTMRGIINGGTPSGERD
jgi:hypothetical protein